MKKTVTIIFILTYIGATDFNILLEEAVKKRMVEAVEGLGKETLRHVRSITNTSTDEEACNKLFGKYMLENIRIAGTTNSKNIALKRMLRKHNINHRHIVKQRTYNISIDIQKLKKQSCNNNQFNELKTREKHLKKLQIENDVLKEIMRLNNIKDTSSNEYYGVKDDKNEEEEHKKAKEALKEQLRKSILGIK